MTIEESEYYLKNNIINEPEFIIADDSSEEYWEGYEEATEEYVRYLADNNHGADWNGYAREEEYWKRREERLISGNEDDDEGFWERKI